MKLIDLINCNSSDIHFYIQIEVNVLDRKCNFDYCNGNSFTLKKKQFKFLLNCEVLNMRKFDRGFIVLLENKVRY